MPTVSGTVTDTQGNVSNWSASWTVDTGQTPAFPGHQPGKIYLGMSTDTDWNTEVSKLGGPQPAAEPVFQPNYTTRCTSALQAKRIPWISTKPDDIGASSTGPAGWAQVAAGGTTIDNAIRSLFRSLQAISQTGQIVYTFHHEPMGDGTNAQAADWVAAWNHIIDVVEADSQVGGVGSHGRFLFAPVMEEFKFRSPGSTNLSSWHPASLMARFDFYGFDAYQYDANAPAVLFSNRFAAVRTFVQGVKPGCLFGVREHGGRNGYKTTTASRPSGAVFYRDMANFLFAHPEWFWIASYFNAVGVENSRLDQPRMSGDIESLLDIYREKIALTATLP